MASENDTLKEWAKTLRELLEEAARAAKGESPTTIASVQKKLRKFPEESPAAADSLDRTALLAVLDLDAGNAAEIGSRLRARSDEVMRLAKLIGGVAADAKKSAAALRGERVTATLSSVNGTIAAFKELKESLKNNAEEKAIASDIDELIASIQKLRDTVEVL